MQNEELAAQRQDNAKTSARDSSNLAKANYLPVPAG